MDGSMRAVPENENSTVSGDKRIKALTGIRWIAALAVFASHTLSVPPVPDFISAIAQKGYFGVTLFFILSGFILTITYLAKFKNPSFSTVFNFFVARFARIYPLYLVCLVTSLILYFILNKEFPGYFLEHFFALQAWSGSTDVAFGLNGPGWSIGVELFLYATFPIIIFSLHKVWESPFKSWLLFISCALFMILVSLVFNFQGLDSLPDGNPNSAHRWLYRMPLMRLGDFLLGVSLAAIFVASDGFIRQGKKLFKVFLPLLIAITSILLLAVPVGKAYSWDVAWAIPFALILFVVAMDPNSLFSKWLGTNHMVFLGEISFAFYLSHAIVIQVFNTVISSHVTFWIDFLLKFTATLVLSVLLYKYLEVPSRVFIRNRFNAEAISRIKKSI